MENIQNITIDKLTLFINSLVNSGKKVVAPKQRGDKYYYSQIKSFDEIAINYFQTALSPKSTLFPRCEELFHFVFANGNNVVEELSPKKDEVIVFGIRPCDAAAMEYMSAFFLKENPDKRFYDRLANTTFISLACNKSDESCFCTSVGLSPGETRGSDIQITDLGNGKFYTEVLTKNGNNLIKANQSFFVQSEKINKEQYLAKVQERFNLDDLREKIKVSFDTPVWQMQSLACIGCGACAFSCPTCSCFDIQDEGTQEEGNRYRTWDSCAFGLFTQHASGHNPRHVQSERWRNRILHKFDYSDRNLKYISCVGCGRCARICPAGMNILEQINVIMEG